MELNGLYEYLFDLGTMLQSNKCLDVFDDNFRPWPHLYKNKGRSKKFYKTVDRNLKSDLLRIRLDPTREDAEKYNGIIQEVLTCGINEASTTNNHARIHSQIAINCRRLYKP